jgi:Zn-dependent protease with chaperone function
VQVELVAGIAVVAVLAGQALLAARSGPRPHPAPAAPAAQDGPPTAEQRGWTRGWRITASVVLARTLVLVLLGLTPLGAVLLVPISSVGATLATPLTVLVIGGLAWLPSRLARPARSRIYRDVPLLRPLRADGGASSGARVGTALLVGMVLLVLLGRRVHHPVVGLAGVVGYGLGVILLVRLRRSSGIGRPVVDATLPPEQGVDRLVAARATLDRPGPPVRLVVGRFAGRGVNAWATRIDRAWTLVVAPELLTRVSDRELRALLAHELGHVAPAGTRRRGRAVGALAIAVVLLGLGLLYAVWDRVTPWLVTGLDGVPDGYGDPLLPAMQLAVGYLAFLALRPLVLVVFRADEAEADRGMLRMTADPQACASFLALQPVIFGLPRRWSVVQLLLIATHPAIDDRISAVRAPTVAEQS